MTPFLTPFCMRTAGVLVLAVHRKRVRRGVIGSLAQVPGRIVKVAVVLAGHSAVGPFQLADVVVIVRVITAVTARVPDALVARIVEVFAFIKDGVRAVVQISAGKASDAVVGVRNVTGVGQRQLDGQAGRLPYFVTVSKRAGGGSHVREPMGGVVRETVGPGASRLLEYQAASHSRGVVN